MQSMIENPLQQQQVATQGEETPHAGRQPLNVIKSVHKKSLREL